MTSDQNANARVGRIAVLLPSLQGGGAEWSMLTLIRGLIARDHEVDLLLCKAKGAFMGEIPEGTKLITLEPSSDLFGRLRVATLRPKQLGAMLMPVVLAKKNPHEIAHLGSLRRYLESGRADVLVSALTYTNLIALWARDACDRPIPVIVSERNAIATQCAQPRNKRKWRWRGAPQLVRQTYPSADAVVTVSAYVAEELATKLGVGRSLLTTIHNPVVDDAFHIRAAEEINHDWFLQGAPPVVLGVGRLSEQKDFATLIQAFARVRRKRRARLMLLGEGRLRGDLEALVVQLGIQDDVEMPGFVSNPIKYMKHAALLVSSSIFEGLPGVLIQALATGCPVVSTNCPGGSAEILEQGKLGTLVKVGDHEAMADAIVETLDSPPDGAKLRERAQDFSVARGVEDYLALIDRVYARAKQVC